MGAERSYVVKVGCDNCGRFGTVVIRQQAQVTDAHCPYCSTRSLVRVLWIWPWQRRFRKGAQAWT